MGSIFGGDKPKKPPPSKSEKALAEVSAQQWNHYVTTYRGPEAQMIEDARHSKIEAHRDKNDAGMEAEVAFAEQGEAAKKGLLAKNDSNSGSFKMKMGEIARNSATIRGRGKAVATANSGTETLRGLTGVMAVGRSKADVTVGSLKELGRQETNLANANMFASLQTSMARANARSEVFGAAAGAAIGFGMGGKPAT